MTTEWTKERFSNEPIMFVKIGPSTWLQRRNITKLESTENDPNPGYECESRKISDDIYQSFMNTLNGPSHEEIVNDQIDIMEAIADIYMILEGRA